MNSFYRPFHPLYPVPERQLDDMVEALSDQDDQRHFFWKDEPHCLGDFPWEDADNNVN